MHLSLILQLRTDRGSEFTSNKFWVFCDSESIIQEYAEPNVHQPNAVPEINNELIMNMCRCLMFNSGVPRSWFEEAILPAIYINRLPCRSIENRMRIELWRKKAPDLSKLRVLGCLAYPLDKKYKGKLDSRKCSKFYSCW